MSIVTRKQKNKEELKTLIMDSACHIINTEGINHLTMRKIATRIDYTPTTIYKYFKNKDELLASIISETTIEISAKMKELNVTTLNPEAYFMHGSEGYIKMMLKKSEHFKATIMNDMTTEHKFRIFSPKISSNPAVLNLYNCIKAGMEQGIFAENNVETLTQFIWISIYGLISRLILEPGMTDEEETKIIQSFLSFLLKSLKK